MAKKKELIDEKKIIAVMKKFIGSTKNDPEESKYFRIQNGNRFTATNTHKFSSMAVHVELQDVNLWSDIEGFNTFAKPMTGGAVEYADKIDGYPNVPDFFERQTGIDKMRFVLDMDCFEPLLKTHEAMVTLGKAFDNSYSSMLISEKKLTVSIRNTMATLAYIANPLEVDEWSDSSFNFNYDPALMVECLKAVKELKPHYVTFRIAGDNQPLFITAEGSNYKFTAALQRKLVRSGNDGD